MKNTRNIVLTGLLIAVGIVLSSAVKYFGGQPTAILFSPMHFPVLLAGLAIGPVEGLICGIFSPLLSYLITGMPPTGPWAMMCELGTYGLVSGLFMRLLKNQKGLVKIYVSLIIAMILGRIVGGFVTGFILNPGTFSVSGWIEGYFVGTLPGIITDLILLPIIVQALQRANLIDK